MAYTTINKSTAHFNTKLTTGTGNSQAVTGLGFQPDWIWGKRRDSTGNHSLFDAVRGITKGLETNSTGAEWTSTDYYSSFDSDGFTIAAGSSGVGNGSSQTAVQWCWKANGAGSANSDGSITSTVSANTVSGMSVVSYTGNGGSTAKTVGHGLGVAPEVVIIKPTNLAYDWMVYHKDVGATKGMCLNTTQASFTSSNFNDTAPTTSVFSVKNNATNETNGTYIAYCFAEKVGYSKFGKYIGNGSTDGTFVYTGFKPTFILTKDTSATSEWHIYDNKRDTNNPNSAVLCPNGNYAESTNSNGDTDFLSNGFKLRNSNSNRNGSGNTYIYMAFGQSIVGTNNIPCTAF